MSDIAPHVPKHPAYRVWRDVAPEERAERLLGVITRYVDGEKLETIAQSIGISHSALNMALLEYAEGDWKRAQVAHALARLETAQEERDKAEDMLSLARARDREKSAQWQLERLLRRIYGQDAPEAGGRVSIQINLGAPHIVDGGSIIEHK